MSDKFSISSIVDSVIKTANEVGNYETENIQIKREVEMKNGTVGDTKELVEDSLCCPRIRISSSGRALHLYPSLMGEYKLVKEMSELLLYKKTGQDMFLYKPSSDTPGKKYSWSVSHSHKLSWGYLEGRWDGTCPNMVDTWRVFDYNIQQWARDITMRVICSD